MTVRVREGAREGWSRERERETGATTDPLPPKPDRPNPVTQCYNHEGSMRCLSIQTPNLHTNTLQSQQDPLDLLEKCAWDPASPTPVWRRTRKPFRLVTLRLQVYK